MTVVITYLADDNARNRRNSAPAIQSPKSIIGGQHDSSHYISG
nr:MAG TPA: hypothetical protein [Caudoviricetes sp.]